MTCARCAELEEEVAYLRGELGLTRNMEREHRLRSALRARNLTTHANGAALLLLALYAAGGAVRTPYQLLDAIPSREHNEDRNPGVVVVYIHCARKAIGFDAIENVWGRGYRLSDAGAERVKALLDGAEMAEPVPQARRGSESARPTILRLLGHGPADFKAIRAAMPWAAEQTVRNALYALREHGAVQFGGDQRSRTYRLAEGAAA
jgi:hypothetical protein